MTLSCETLSARSAGTPPPDWPSLRTRPMTFSHGKPRACWRDHNARPPTTAKTPAVTAAMSLRFMESPPPPNDKAQRTHTAE